MATSKYTDTLSQGVPSSKRVQLTQLIQLTQLSVTGGVGASVVFHGLSTLERGCRHGF